MSDVVDASMDEEAIDAADQAQQSTLRCEDDDRSYDDDLELKRRDPFDYDDEVDDVAVQGEEGDDEDDGDDEDFELKQGDGSSDEDDDVDEHDDVDGEAGKGDEDEDNGDDDDDYDDEDLTLSVRTSPMLLPLRLSFEDDMLSDRGLSSFGDSFLATDALDSIAQTVIVESENNQSSGLDSFATDLLESIFAISSPLPPAASLDAGPLDVRLPEIVLSHVEDHDPAVYTAARPPSSPILPRRNSFSSANSLLLDANDELSPIDEEMESDRDTDLILTRHTSNSPCDQDANFLVVPPPFTPRAHRYRSFSSDRSVRRRDSLRTELMDFMKVINF